MEKRKYYVSVQSKTILANQGEAAYELEIEATPEDLAKLHALFEDQYYSETDNFLRVHAAGVPYHFDASNDAYDMALHDIYSLIYELGTEQTKKHIESMHVL